MRVLLTTSPDSQNYISAHILDLLLARGHSVVTTVGSPAIAQLIHREYPHFSKNQLDCAIIEGKAHGDGNFDEAVVSDPPFEAVIHPNYYEQVKSNKPSDRALLKATSIFTSIMKNAPAIKRIVIGSPFASMLDQETIADKVYSEADWNPFINIKMEALWNPTDGFSSHKHHVKYHAERAAWDFVETENPNFTLTSCVLPVLLGPHYAGLQHPMDNISNQRIGYFLRGYAKNACPPTDAHFFVDVRDVALSFVLAAEKEEAAGKRFFIVADKFSNKQIVEIMADEFPRLRNRLPTGKALQPGDFLAITMPGFDNRRSVEVLGMTYRSLRESVVDNVKRCLQFLPLPERIKLSQRRKTRLVRGTVSPKLVRPIFGRARRARLKLVRLMLSTPKESLPITAKESLPIISIDGITSLPVSIGAIIDTYLDSLDEKS